MNILQASLPYANFLELGSFNYDLGLIFNKNTELLLI